MSQSKNPEAYPLPVIEAVNHLLATGEPLELCFASPQLAHRARFTLYGYLRALRSSESPLATEAANILIQIEAETTLVLSLRDKSRFAEAFGEALDRALKRPDDEAPGEAPKDGPVPTHKETHGLTFE